MNKKFSARSRGSKITVFCAIAAGVLTLAPPALFAKDAAGTARPAQEGNSGGSDPRKTTAAAESVDVAGFRRKLGLTFVRIPGGEFQMGSTDPDAFEIEKPVHRVLVAEFQIGKTEVTQSQWAAVMGANPSRFSGCDDCPVEQVSWNGVQEFIARASALTGLPLRLPTEAEWEYAARGGARHQRWAGTDSMFEVGAFAWFDMNSNGKTHPVCRKRPNAFGLCDMTGNVFEWVADRYGKGYDTPLPPENPADPNEVWPRILRGGGWGYNARLARTTYRGGNAPDVKSGSLGFRLALPAAGR